MLILTRTRDIWAFSSGVLVALTGLVVLFGWYTQNYFIVQIHPSFVPMQFNTALCFLFSGIGLIFLVLNFNKSATIFGGITASIGLVTLFQYVSGLNVGLDELFMKHEVTTRTSHSGRMAPNTALCFFLTGSAIIAGVLFRSFPQRNQIVRFIGGLAMILGIIAFCGYLSGIEATYGWADLTRMAVHTSVCFITIGSGIVANSWFDRGISLDNSLAYWFAGSMACFILVMAFILSGEIQSRELKALERNVQNKTAHIIDKIREIVNSDILAIGRLGDRWELKEGIQEDEWRADASNYINDLPGLSIVAYVDENKEVVWLESSPETSIPAQFKFPPHKLALMDKTLKSSAKFTVFVSQNAPELNLFSALDVNWKNDGFIFARFDIRKKLETILSSEDLAFYGLTITSGEKILYKSADKSANIPSYRGTVDFHGARWRVEVWARDPLLHSTLSGLAVTPIIGGIFIAILTSLAIIFALRSLIMARRIRENEKRMQAILDNVVEGIITIDEKGNIETFNNACEKLFGYKPEEVLGKNVKMLMPVHFADEHDGYLGSFMKTGKRKIIGTGREVEGLTKQGRIFPMDLSVGEISRENKKGFTGIVRDISERKKFEEDQGRLIDMLAKSNSELDDFAYIASHDMKEPLRAIHNHSMFLLEDYEDKLDEDGVKKLNRLIALSKRMEKLTNDLLYFSRLGREKLAYKETNMDNVITDINDMLYDTLVEKNAIIEKIGPLPDIKCDTVRVTELFRNLIVNGIKYNSQEQKTIEIGYLDDEGAFFVKDNGIGIEKEHHKDVFRIFKRLNSDKAFGTGSGAGLTFVKKIVENHGGRIWIDSEPGSGTTFYFTLKGKAA